MSALKIAAGVAAGVVVGAGVVVAAKKGLEWNERRKFAKLTSGNPQAGNIFSFIGSNAKNMNTALGHAPVEQPQQKQAAQ
jgi:hypothetical protein